MSAFTENWKPLETGVENDSATRRGLDAQEAGRYPEKICANKMGLSLKLFRAGVQGAVKAGDYTLGEWHHDFQTLKKVAYYDAVKLNSLESFWFAVDMAS